MRILYEYKTRIRVHDADAAGVLFFGGYFALAHDAFEAFMQDRGIGFGFQIREGDYIITVVRAESEHRLPLWVGEEATVSLRVEELRRKTFTLVCDIENPEGKRSCTVRTKHMAVDKGTGKAVAMPDSLVVVLNAVSDQTGPLRSSFPG